MSMSPVGSSAACEGLWTWAQPAAQLCGADLMNRHLHHWAEASPLQRLSAKQGRSMADTGCRRDEACWAGQPREMRVVFGVMRSPGSFTDGISGQSPPYSPEGSTHSMSSDCRDT